MEVGKTSGVIFPHLPSFASSCQDSTPPLTEAPTRNLYTWLLLGDASFCDIFYPLSPILNSTPPTSPKHLYGAIYKVPNNSFQYYH